MESKSHQPGRQANGKLAPLMTAALTMLVAAPLLMAQGQATVQPEEGFPWGIHLITIPLVLAFGILVGWSLRERKAQADEARRTAASGDKPSV